MPQSDIAPHIPRPLLLTLGRLELSFNALRQDKLLLLLAYLNLEGTKGRKFVAELFWPEATNPMNSLAVALKKLREAGAAEADTARVWATVGCDALLLREHLRAGRLAEAVALYGGPFGEGVATKEKAVHGEVQRLIGEELEEWFFATREALASEVRGAWLGLAEQEAAAGRFIEAGAKAEAAYRLSGGPPLEAEELIRLYRLLLAAEHPLREALEREARELEVVLPQSAEAMRGKLRQTLIGRKRELETLLALEPGEWAWVRGGDGMGKTALLKELEAKTGWRYLLARSGLPFATLEPLVRDVEGGEEAVLRRLSRQHHDLLLDDWEAIDPESQRVLGRLRTLRPEFRVVLAGRGEVAFGVDCRIELATLSPEDLAGHVGAYEVTDGVPGLVGAWLRMEPLEGVLEARLAKLSQAARNLYCSLALLETPNLTLVRQSLGIEASLLAQSHESLLAAGLVEPSGQVRGYRSAINYLDAYPNTKAKLALALARNLDGEVALPLYRISRSLWEQADVPQIQESYIGWAKELLRRGFPLKATEVLEEAPQTYDVVLLLARAHERAGRNHIVTKLLATLPETPETLAVQSSVWVRYGEMEKAREAALKAKDGSIEAQAEAYMTLGKYEMHQANYKEAELHFQRSARLWMATDQKQQHVNALNHRAMMITRQNLLCFDNSIYDEALAAAGDNLQMQAHVTLSISSALGLALQHQRSLDTAFQALKLAEKAEAQQLIAAAWNNIAVAYDHLEDFTQARQAYAKCLDIAIEIDDRRLIGMSLTSLAMADKDHEAVMEGVEYLRNNGFVNMSKAYLNYFTEVLAIKSSERLGS